MYFIDCCTANRLVISVKVCYWNIFDVLNGELIFILKKQPALE